MVALSLVLFLCDCGLNCFTALRTTLPFIVVPLQRVTNWPIDLVQTFTNNLTSKRTLLKENTRLRSELLLANVQLQRLDFLEQDNSQLRILLSSAKQLKAKFLAAQLLTLIANSNQQVNIDKGKIDGTYVGQPVVDAYGLFGQVTLVGSNVSKVLLVTDIKSAIPVMIIRNGVQAIANGTGSNNSLELVNTPETTDIKEGDFLVTSGIGQRFPAGYAVGIVKAIKRVSGERFIKALITPSAHIKSSRNVLLIWTNFSCATKK